MLQVLGVSFSMPRMEMLLIGCSEQFPRTYRYDSPGTTSEAFTVQLYSEQLHENAAILHYCSISAMPIYRNWSFEVCRLPQLASSD